MKTFFAAVFCAPFLSWAATAAVGGRIPPISSLACTAAPTLDFSREGVETPVATCVIRNNSPWFEVSFHLDAENGLDGFGSVLDRFTSITWHGVGGVLGQGIRAPQGEDILPRMEGNAFNWTPEEQSTATVDYVVEFRASWKADAAERNISRIRITTDLASAL
jgi:hypothetical protein